MIAVVGTIGYDYMVLEMQTHELASILDALCQFVIGLARSQGAGRMIVAYSENSSIAEYGLLDDNPNVYGSLCEATVRDTHTLDDAVVPIQIQCPELFHVQVSHAWLHIVVDTNSRTKVRSLRHHFLMPTFPSSMQAIILAAF